MGTTTSIAEQEEKLIERVTSKEPVFDPMLERFESAQVRTAFIRTPIKKLKLFQCGYVLYMPGEEPKKNGKPGKPVECVRLLGETSQQAIEDLGAIATAAHVKQLKIMSWKIVKVDQDGLRVIANHFQVEQYAESE